MGKVQPAYPKGLDFEQVWAAIQAGNERLDRLFEEVARRQEEVTRKQEETAEQIKATERQIKATDRQMKATDDKISKLGSRFGEMIEYMVMQGC